ncbi:protein suex-1-like [Euwallacea similis]|uniref:protein suex-1-like n=1 Tax=Euwallacea similis TaxID=1736056 RepID=UPI00344EF011
MKQHKFCVALLILIGVIALASGFQTGVTGATISKELDSYPSAVERQKRSPIPEPLRGGFGGGFGRGFGGGFGRGFGGGFGGGRGFGGGFGRGFGGGFGKGFGGGFGRGFGGRGFGGPRFYGGGFVPFPLIVRRRPYYWYY